MRHQVVLAEEMGVTREEARGFLDENNAAATA